MRKTADVLQEAGTLRAPGITSGSWWGQRCSSVLSFLSCDLIPVACVPNTAIVSDFPML